MSARSRQNDHARTPLSDRAPRGLGTSALYHCGRSAGDLYELPDATPPTIFPRRLMHDRCRSSRPRACAPCKSVERNPTRTRRAPLKPPGTLKGPSRRTATPHPAGRAALYPRARTHQCTLYPGRASGRALIAPSNEGTTGRGTRSNTRPRAAGPAARTRKARLAADCMQLLARSCCMAPSADMHARHIVDSPPEI
jgi:hypothetical protein